jgi:hypothetical protein
MARTLHDKAPHDGSDPEQPARAGRFESLPAEVQEHFRREFQAEQEPGWLQRYQAEVEERRRTGPTLVRKR